MTGPLGPSVRRVIRTIVLMCLGALLPSVSLAQTIVWTDTNAGRIQRKDVNGGEVGTIVQPPLGASQIHYDPVTAKLYYRSGSFQRANLDGSEPENIPTPSVGNFTLNVGSRKLYWIDSASWNVLYRSELNGSGVESHTYASCCLLALEAIGDDLFFGAALTMRNGIWRADADGSNEQFLHSSGEPLDLAHDAVENKLYWVAYDQGIHRMNRDGTGFQQVVFLKLGPDQVVVDSRARKLYWTNPDAKVIQRSNLDGSNVEDFATASDVGNPNFEPRGLTIVYSSTPIPTLSGWGLLVMGAIILGAGLFVLRKHPGARSLASLPLLGHFGIAALCTGQITREIRR